jgi:hypothetical protein
MNYKIRKNYYNNFLKFYNKFIIQIKLLIIKKNFCFINKL